MLSVRPVMEGEVVSLSTKVLAVPVSSVNFDYLGVTKPEFADVKM